MSRIRTNIFIVFLVYLTFTVYGFSIPEHLSKTRTTDESVYERALYGNYSEGDIIRNPIKSGGIARLSVQGHVQWPLGLVYYSIDTSATSNFSSTDLREIKYAMDSISMFTSNCIRFIPRKTEKNYVWIISHSGCYSYVGMIGGAQNLSLQRNGCVNKGTIMHELLHALGFEHEQNRPDRDQYIYVNINNVRKSFQYNFNKESEEKSLMFDQPYDYNSIMHYGPNAFAINHYKPVIVPLKSGVTLTNAYQKIALSKLDIAMIKKFYKCKSLSG